MGVTPSNNSLEVVLHRRELVARAAARGASQRATVKILIKKGVVNPRTKKPFTRSIIQKDFAALREQWRAHASEDIKALQAEVLASLEEIRLTAMDKGNLDAALRANAQIAKMLGLNAPDGLALDVGRGAGASYRPDDLTDEQLFDQLENEDPDWGHALKVIDVTPGPVNGTGGKNGAGAKLEQRKDDNAKEIE